MSENLPVGSSVHHGRFIIFTGYGLQPCQKHQSQIRRPFPYIHQNHHNHGRYRIWRKYGRQRQMQRIHQPHIQTELRIDKEIKHQANHQRRHHHGDQNHGREQPFHLRYCIQSQCQKNTYDHFQSYSTDHENEGSKQGIQKLLVPKQCDIILQTDEYIFAAFFRQLIIIKAQSECIQKRNQRNQCQCQKRRKMKLYCQ